MGSGANRKWWGAKGSRVARRSMTKTRSGKGAASRLRIKAWRAEAKRRAAA